MYNMCMHMYAHAHVVCVSYAHAHAHAHMHAYVQVWEGGELDVRYDDGDVELRKPRGRVRRAAAPRPQTGCSKCRWSRTGCGKCGFVLLDGMEGAEGVEGVEGVASTLAAGGPLSESEADENEADENEEDENEEDENEEDVTPDLTPERDAPPAERVGEGVAASTSSEPPPFAALTPLQQTAPPGWHCCGVNGCVLQEFHRGPCVRAGPPLAASQRRRRAPSAAWAEAPKAKAPRLDAPMPRWRPSPRRHSALESLRGGGLEADAPKAGAPKAEGAEGKGRAVAGGKRTAAALKEPPQQECMVLDDDDDDDDDDGGGDNVEQGEEEGEAEEEQEEGEVEEGKGAGERGAATLETRRAAERARRPPDRMSATEDPRLRPPWYRRQLAAAAAEVEGAEEGKGETVERVGGAEEVGRAEEVEVVAVVKAEAVGVAKKQCGTLGCIK
jgi:hypothetical protein